MEKRNDGSGGIISLSDNNFDFGGFGTTTSTTDNKFDFVAPIGTDNNIGQRSNNQQYIAKNGMMEHITK